MIIFAMSDKTDSLNFIRLDVLMLILMAKVRILMIWFRQDWDADLCGLGSLPPGEDFTPIFAILCKFLGFGKETWARLSFMFELVSEKTELTTRLTGGGRGRRRRWVLRLEILQEEEDHQGTGAVGKTWNHERIRMMRMLMIRWRRPRTSRAWWRPRRSPTSWRRNRSRWDWSLIPLDKDKTDSFQMSITTIESRNAKRYNHVICWAPHHLARGPLSLKCGDGLEEDLKVASATSRSPPTQDLKWDQGIGLWDFSNDYGLFKMPWTRILLLSLEIANNWVRITWVSTYSDQIRLICTN